METLAVYNFKITHIKGTENRCANALSKQPDYAEGTRPALALILRQEGDSLVYRKPQTLATMEIQLNE